MDRSSEERSRFEKNANQVGLDLRRTGTGYTFADVQSRWEGWQARAALEDRQEAAQQWNGALQPNGTVYDNPTLIGILRAELDKFQRMYEVERMKNYIPPPEGHTLGCFCAECKAWRKSPPGVPSEAKNDRQEAAPAHGGDRSHCAICGRADNIHMSSGRSTDGTHDFISRHEARKANSCVPSEATPSKENAPPRVLKLKPQPTDKLVTTRTVNGTFLTPICGRCGEAILPITGCPCVIEPAAPAPEVQGTPRSLGKLIHDATIQKGGEFVVTGKEFEIMCAATPGPQAVGASLFCGKKLRVGTPQKETPPTFEQTAEEQHEADVQDVTYNNGDSYVPEGVQGKEPQTPEEERYESMTLALEPCPDCGSRHHRSCAVTALSDNPCIVAGDIPADRPGPFLSEYLRGEAAGRRSAITELQEWMKNCCDLQNAEALMILAKCAELQEKTK